MNPPIDAPAPTGRAEAQLRVLERAIALLSSTATLDDALASTLDACLPALGDFGHFDVVVGDEVRRVARAADDEPAATALRQQRWRRRPPEATELSALCSGWPVLHPEMDAAWYQAMATGDDEELDAWRRLGAVSMLSVPLRHAGELVGALSLFMGRSGRRHGADELEFAGLLAALAAPPVVSARLREAQHRAEAAWRASEERLRLALEAGRLGLWEWNVADDRFSGCERFYQLHGLVPGAFGGRLADFQALVHPEDREAMARQMQRALDTGTGFAAEFRVLHPGNDTRWLATYAKVHATTPDGRPLRLAGASYDATERLQLLAAERTARADAEAARGDAEAANRAKDEFLAMLGHELRNPLAPIVTALHLMELRGESSTLPERELIARQVAHLSRLVDDLLDVSRITQGKVALKLERLDIAAVVRKAVEQVWPALEKRSLHFEASLPCDPLQVQGDAVRLAQVLSNLLGNAAKFTPAGGQVTLAVTADEAEVQVAVRDSGVGIAPELLPRVFDLFVQGPRRLDRIEGGLGLGLAIARTLVQMHQGRIAADSPGPGMGSVFTVTLPRAAPADAAPPRPAEPGPRPAAARLLVVDDNEDAAEMLTQLLMLAGHEVRSAPDGPSALALVQTYLPDVAVLDIGLPGMDGYMLARQLKAQPQLAGMRLVALTGYGREPDRERAHAAGFDEHLVKPVDPQRLLQVLAALVEARRQTPV